MTDSNITGVPARISEAIKNSIAHDISGKPDGTVLDGFHIIWKGKKTRVFPATGPEVDPLDLGNEVIWVGDNISFGDPEIVTLADRAGNWASIPADLVREHEVWDRINAYGQKRITDGFNSRR